MSKHIVSLYVQVEVEADSVQQAERKALLNAAILLKQPQAYVSAAVYVRPKP